METLVPPLAGIGYLFFLKATAWSDGLNEINPLAISMRGGSQPVNQWPPVGRYKWSIFQLSR
jgi:hypothetical protein